MFTTLGMRRGEIAGLRWDALDLDDERPSVEIKTQRTTAEGVPGYVVEQAPKGTSERSLPLRTCWSTRFVLGVPSGSGNAGRRAGSGMAVTTSSPPGSRLAPHHLHLDGTPRREPGHDQDDRGTRF